MENRFCAGIHILIKNGNKYLLLKRSRTEKEEPVCWDLPGGGIDFGEQPQEAAVREAKEEAGVAIKVIKTLALWAMPYQENWSIEAIVEAEYLSGKVKLSEEHADFRWVTPAELRKIKPQSVHLRSLNKYVADL